MAPIMAPIIVIAITQYPALIKNAFNDFCSNKYNIPNKVAVQPNPAKKPANTPTITPASTPINIARLRQQQKSIQKTNQIP